MPISIENKSVLTQVETFYFKEEKKIVSSNEWADFLKSYKSLRKAAPKGLSSFDPKFNSVHWSFAANSLCRQIAFSYCWMQAYARFYKGQVQPGTQPADTVFHVTYFADNCLTRIDSCRDKVALMVWAYYCPFNPEKRDETLDYHEVMQRLKYPLRFGLSLKNHDLFVDYLETLKGKDFDRIERYRNYKVHRIEPRIEIYGVKPHHGWSYMIPLYNKNEIEKWEQDLTKLYPDKEFRERIKKGCYIKGVLFESRKISDSLWDYDEVCRHIESSMKKLFKATAGCFSVLTRRVPLRKRSRNNQRIGGLVKS